MLTHLRLLALLVSMLWQTDPALGEKDPPSDPTKSDDDVKFDPKQQERVNALLAAERKDAEKRTADRIKQEAADREKRDQEKRDQDEAAKRGDFDKVRTDLEGKLETVTGERDTLNGENDALTTYFTGQYDAALAELPDVIKAFKSADDASFTAKSEWLTKAQAQAKTMPKEIVRGNQPNPRGREGDNFNETAEVAKARRTIRI